MKIFILLACLTLLFFNIYSQFIPLNGMRAFWPLSGDAIDYGPNNLNGTINGDPISSPDRFGRQNSCLFFDGIDDFIRIGKPIPDSLKFINPFSISVWVKPTGYGVDYLGGILASQWDPEHTGYSVMMDYRDNVHGGRIGGVHFQIGKSYDWWTTSMQGTTSDSLRINKWNHIIAIGGIGYYKVYINGQLAANWIPSETITYSDNCDMLIGLNIHIPGSNRFFRGYIDDVIVYNRALTEEEIREIYHSPLQQTTVEIEKIFKCAGESNPIIKIKYPKSNCIYYITGTNIVTSFNLHTQFDTLIIINPDDYIINDNNALIKIVEYYPENSQSNVVDSFQINVFPFPEPYSQDTVYICKGDTFWFNNKYYTQSGIYYDTIYNEYGCASEIYTFLINVNEINYIIDKQNSTCELNNGIAEINSINGGTPPYTITWFNLQHMPYVDNLPVGIYNFTITDALGCNVYDSIEIINEHFLHGNITKITNADCNQNNGSFTINAESDEDIHILVLKHNNILLDTTVINNCLIELNNLFSGEYIVEMFNDFCSYDTVIRIYNPVSLTYMATPILCKDSAEIYININGGTPPYYINIKQGNFILYSYNIFSNDTIIKLPDLPPVEIYLKDINNCEFYTSFIYEGYENGYVSSNFSYPNCMNSDGKITLQVQGTGIYKFTWNTGDTTNILNNIPSGYYSYTVTDENNCIIDSASFFIEGIDTTNNLNFIINNGKCLNSYGTIEILDSLYQIPQNIRFLWSTGDTVNKITNLVSSEYLVTITNINNNCTTIKMFTINNPQLFINYQTINAPCYSNYGSISINYYIWPQTNETNKQYPYIYDYNGDLQSADSLLPGHYYILFNYPQGYCMPNCLCNYYYVGDFFIQKDSLIVISEITNNTCYNSNNGSINIINVLNSNPPNSYFWNNGQTGNIVNNLHAGTYIVTIIDSQGCSIINSFNITQPDSIIYNQHFTLCEGHFIYVGNHEYNQTGVYYDTLTANNGCDSIIITNLTVNPVFIINNNYVICEGSSLIVGNHEYTQTGVYYDTLTANNGCDSIIITNLTVNPIFTINNNYVICEGSSLIVGNHEYTQTGIYYDTLNTISGCDSIIITNLTVNPAYIIYNNQEICEGSYYEINGHIYYQSGIYYDTLNSLNNCDSIIVTSLNVNPTYYFIDSLKICKYDSVTWHNITYYTEGNYTLNYQTISGCDSTFELHLSYYNINSDFIINGDTLISECTDCVYQWLLCDGENVFPIENETNQTFIIQNSGFYALIVKNYENCSDTSECVFVQFSKYSDFMSNTYVSVFPNPTQEYVIVTFKNLNSEHYEIILYDNYGKIINNYFLNGNSPFKIILPENKGLYFIVINTKKTFPLYFKIIKI